jgi:hypothetical protein
MTAICELTNASSRNASGLFTRHEPRESSNDQIAPALVARFIGTLASSAPS